MSVGSAARRRDAPLPFARTELGTAPPAVPPQLLTSTPPRARVLRYVSGAGHLYICSVSSSE